MLWQVVSDAASPDPAQMLASAQPGEDTQVLGVDSTESMQCAQAAGVPDWKPQHILVSCI